MESSPSYRKKSSVSGTRRKKNVRTNKKFTLRQKSEEPLVSISQTHDIATKIINNSIKFVKSNQKYVKSSNKIINLLEELKDVKLSMKGSSKRNMVGGAINMKYILGDFLALIAACCSIACMISIYHDSDNFPICV